MNSSGDLWYVKLANGDVHRVTLDQLDGAFQGGHIDANTLVMGTEQTQWMRLGELAGLDDEAEPVRVPVRAPARRQAPAAAYAAVPSHAPVRRAAPAPSYAPVHRAAAVPSYAPAQRAVPGPAYATVHRPAPVAAYAPARPVASYAPVPNSIRPVSMDLDDFDLNDAAYKRRSSKGGWFVAVLAVAAMGAGVGMAATHGQVGRYLPPSVAAAFRPADPPAPPAPPPPPVQPASPVVAPPPPIAPPVTNTLPPGDSPLQPRFTDAQREQLLKVDKQREDKSKVRHAAGGAAASHGSSTKYKSMGFTTNGNKFDPLNSSL
jgi:hypothetical protein